MNTFNFFEAAFVPGMERAVEMEFRHRLGKDAKILTPSERTPGQIAFHYSGSPHHLLQLKTVGAVFWVMRFPIPRPRALLGHQYFTQLLERIAAVRAMSPKNSYQTVYLAAAGSESAVMQRLLEEIARETHLEPERDEGDLLVRVRRPADGSEGWEAAVRMSPRPISVRPWRVCDWKGALNAGVAYGMATYSQPNTDDFFLNLCCGSGSLMIERLLHSPARLAVGCDIDPEALACARENARAARLEQKMLLAPWDACALPLPAESVDVIVADLPFGHHVGSHSDNVTLYPALLQEAARVAKSNARCLMLTHEIRLMTALLEQDSPWIATQVIPLTLNGLHPRLYFLRKNTQ